MLPSPWSPCTLLVLVATLGGVFSYGCYNPDTAHICSGSGTCKDYTCHCDPGYSGEWCQTCTNCEEKCGEVRGCLECLLYGSGPTKHAGQCDNCGHVSAFFIENIEDGQFDPRKSKISNNGSCQILDDFGCNLYFWYGYDESNNLQVWSEKTSRDCPPSEDSSISERCVKKSTCMDCERTPGCGWCSTNQRDIESRCNSMKEIKKVCPAASIEKKLNSSLTVVKDDVTQLRPQSIQLVMNVGDLQYLQFSYRFVFSGARFSHDFPEEVDLKIFSTCGGRFPLKEVSGCYGIRMGKTVQFFARLQLTSCPGKASDWQRSYQLVLRKDAALDIDFKAFCSCSCDKFTTTGVCRNDKKTFLELNPCAEKDTCAECLDDSSCNWCAAPRYSYTDGSPLPRCNNDTFWSTHLCPREGRVDPPNSLRKDEDCTSCKHTCSGGVCSEDKSDILDLNTCVSQLTCGDCLAIAGCAWCTDTVGAARCNYARYWEQEKNVCRGKMYADQAQVSTDKLEFYGHGGRRINLWSNPEFDNHSVDMAMKLGTVFNLDITWNITAGKQTINPDFWKEEPTYDQVILKMISKDTAAVSKLDMKYDYVCNGNPCSSRDVLSDMENMLLKVSIELLECPKDGITDPVYLSLHGEGDDKFANKDLYPYGVIRINIKTLCGCDCEEKCNDGYVKLHSSCQGGNMQCGVCQDCPDGSYGEFCQCSADGTERPASQLSALPSIEIGNKDNLVGKSAKKLKNKMSFDHVIRPNEVSADTLKCNATYCMNTNSRECYGVSSKYSNFDIARAANLFAIYGDHPLLPGSELIFKITYCELKLSFWGTHETRFGFGVPPTRDNEYKLPKKNSFYIQKFWADELVSWKVDNIGRDGLIRMDYDYGAWFEKEHWRTGEKYQSFQNVVSPGIDYVGNVNQNTDSEVKLVVAEDEVIWSWDGFRSSAQPQLTDLRQKFNMTAKEYYPIFIIPGCEKDGQFSSVKIISSKLGEA